METLDIFSLTTALLVTILVVCDSYSWTNDIIGDTFTICGNSGVDISAREHPSGSIQSRDYDSSSQYFTQAGGNWCTLWLRGIKRGSWLGIFVEEFEVIKTPDAPGSILMLLGDTQNDMALEALEGSISPGFYDKVIVEDQSNDTANDYCDIRITYQDKGIYHRSKARFRIHFVVADVLCDVEELIPTRDQGSWGYMVSHKEFKFGLGESTTEINVSRSCARTVSTWTINELFVTTLYINMSQEIADLSQCGDEHLTLRLNRTRSVKKCGLPSEQRTDMFHSRLAFDRLYISLQMTEWTGGFLILYTDKQTAQVRSEEKLIADAHSLANYTSQTTDEPEVSTINTKYSGLEQHDTALLLAAIGVLVSLISFLFVLMFSYKIRNEMRREMSIIPSRDEHRQNEEIDGTRGNISYEVIRPSHRAPAPLPRPNIFSIHEPTAAAQMPEYETILPSLYLPGPYATYDYTHLPPALKASDQLPCGQRVSNLSVRKWSVSTTEAQNNITSVYLHQDYSDNTE